MSAKAGELQIDPNTGIEFDSYSPHTQTRPWGGVPGIFKQLTVQAGLDYDVALSTRNAATLRGHFLNTANSNWNMRGNIGSQRWDQVVLQEQSDEPLTARTANGVALGSNYPSFQAYVDLIEDWVHQGTARAYIERDLFTSIYGSVANCLAAGGTNGTCNSGTNRNIPQNTNANAAAQVFLQQTWARPNLINAPGAAVIDPRTGNATYDPSRPVPGYFASLEEMTDDLAGAYQRAAAFAGADHSGGIAGIAPVGQAFLRAVQLGLATRDPYASDAGSDGLIDLWFNDGTHASVWGSYLSALTTFGTVTGLDPAMFGEGEIAARDLGIAPREAWLLQRVASVQLGFRNRIPEPGTLATVVLGLLALLAAGACRRGPKAMR